MPEAATNTRIERLEAAFMVYATAYKHLEDLQREEAELEVAASLIPCGDQKTGAIGEYWSRKYAKNLWDSATISFGHHSQKGWDIRVEPLSGHKRFIQVKTASKYGEGCLSAIRKPNKKTKERKGSELPDFWDELWILYLDKAFVPVGFWRLTPSQIDWTKAPAKGTSDRMKTDSLSSKKVPCCIPVSSRHWIHTPKDRTNQITAFRSSVGLPALPSPDR